MTKYLPTKLAPLPYKSAPLTREDIIMERVRFEEAFLPHIIYDPQEPEVMHKELPDTKWSPASAHIFGINITRFMHSLI